MEKNTTLKVCTKWATWHGIFGALLLAAFACAMLGIASTEETLMVAAVWAVLGFIFGGVYGGVFAYIVVKHGQTESTGYSLMMCTKGAACGVVVGSLGLAAAVSISALMMFSADVVSGSIPNPILETVAEGIINSSAFENVKLLSVFSLAGALACICPGHPKTTVPCLSEDRKCPA